MPADAKTYLAQTELARLGLYKGAIDGDHGPLTTAALVAFTEAHPDTFGGIAAPGKGGVASRMLAAMLTQEGVRETSKNQGPGIAKYWEATTYGPDGYKNREPYCSALICWAMAEAVKHTSPQGFRPFRSAKAYDVEAWAKKNAGNGVTTLDNASAARSGDLFTLSAVSHIGQIVRIEGNVAVTIEGNTDGSGSREGDGVYIRRRALSGMRAVIRINV